jgi:hypothetical protein
MQNDLMTNSIANQIPAEKQTPFLKWAVYILGFLFFLNCFTPLRIHFDMLRYFSIKDCIESKCPPGADPHDFLPYGYTILLLLLSKLGILRSFSIVLANCLYLFGGLYFVKKIFGYTRTPYFLFYLVLMNWTIIKFTVHPLSELQYLFLSLYSLYEYFQFVRNKKIKNLLLAFLFALLATLTRTIGVAIIAAIFSALAWDYRKQLLLLLKKNRLLVVAFFACIVLVIVFSRQLGLNHYLAAIATQFNEGLHFSKILVWHFSEWGEILLNNPRAKMISILPYQLGFWLFFITGIVGISAFIYICFIRKNRIPYIIKAYLFFYILLLFNWPFPDPRFWVPVVPLIAAVVSQFSFSQFPKLRWAGFFYFVFYSVFGVIAISFLTYTSFNKKEFSKTQASGIFRNEYETHFFGKTLSDTVTRVDTNLVDFLNKYDK